LSRKVAEAGCEQIAKVLPSGTALVEFAGIETSCSGIKDLEKSMPDRYIGFVHNAGENMEVRIRLKKGLCQWYPN
jgi:hypothetical protein